MATTKKWTGARISSIASRVFFILIIFQVPLFRIQCRAGMCTTPIQITSCQLVTNDIFPAPVVKTLLYPGAAVNSLITSRSLPKWSELFEIYNLTDAKNASAAVDLHRIEKESERNSANRSKNPVTHRGGSKSFQHHREDLERQRGSHVSYWDVFQHTHALSQLDDSGSVSYSWEHDDRARAAYDKFQQAQASLLADTGRDALTADEEDAIFESVMDPAAHGRRYGFGNQSVSTSQKDYQKAQDKEEIAQLRAEIAELKERNMQHEAKTEELKAMFAEFVAQYGRGPSSGGSEADN